MREKFGKLVLLEETDSTGLGSEYRAAKLGPAGLERIVSILRLKPAISGNADLARRLMDQAKLAAQLQSPNILKILGIGKVEQTYYISNEFVEGKTLQQVLTRCRTEGFPLAPDNALLIASKVCAALEYAHGRRVEGGGRVFHGMVSPERILVSYEGEVRLKGFEYWPGGLRAAGVLSEADSSYLAPEQAAGGPGDGRSDVFSLAAVLFEILTGRAPSPGLQSQIGSARLSSPHGDDDSLPKALVEILNRALGENPGSRYAEIQEMRRALDTLLFSGDFTPTTFNLAFFMHNLYREDIEREARTLEEEKKADYAEFLVEPAAKPAPRPVPESLAPVPVELPVTMATEPADIGLAESMPELPPEPPAPVHEPEPPRPVVTPREAAAGFTFHEEPKGRKTPIFIGAGALLALVIGGAGWFFLYRQPSAPVAPPPTTLSPEEIASKQRILELEQRLAALETERQEAVAKAEEEAKKKLERQAQAAGKALDPQAVQKAQEEARKKAEADAARKQQEELQKLADQKAAEEKVLAEEKRRAEEAAKAEQAKAEAARAAELARAAETPPPTLAAAAAAPPSTQAAAPAPGTTSPGSAMGGLVAPGTLVNLSDPGVSAPVVVERAQPRYPDFAKRSRMSATVIVSALVDEKGNVIDAKVAKGATGFGFNEEAVGAVKRSKYRPALKGGVPVKVWLNVNVAFTLSN
jgi:TonB family protein